MPLIDIDVGKIKLHNALLVDPGKPKTRSKTASNNKKGFKSLLDWSCRQEKCSPEKLHFVMEATRQG